MKAHDWALDYTPGLLIWHCARCGERLRLTVISAADPERLRSTLVILESRCPS